VTSLEALAPTLLVVGLPLLGAALLGTERLLARAVILLPGLVCTICYMRWRWATPLPEGGAVQQGWAWLYLGVETLGALSTVLILLTLLRHRDRTPEADRPAPPALRDAPVDVFICTYNEGPEILERTILCATRIAHRDLRVWVLDDGARPWVAALAAELGAEYRCRVKGRHAKAGNVNNGLAEALAHGRRPEFILLLDADFAAHRGILRRTLPLFAEADVGIVQTPQHFFNPDPVQAGLLASQAWPDEQRFFFNHLMPAKDAWGAAFCCGTSAVLRVRALIEAGGMATETVTEDILTSFKMAEHGWRTVFLNERLSAGLAPEGVSEYVTQRGRWCLGAMQQLFTRWSCVGTGRIGWANRVSQLDTLLYWMASFPARLLVLLAPVMFWWFGLYALQAQVDEMLRHFVPAALATMMGFGLVSRWRLAPVLSDATQLLITVPIMATVAQALWRPFGRPFKVTPKGNSRTTVTVHWSLLAPFAAIWLLTATGMAMQLPDWSSARHEEGYSLNIAWSVLNLFVLGIVIACCVELPRPRQEERFAADEPAQLLMPDGTRCPARLTDLSTRGARVVAQNPPEAPRRGLLLLDGGVLAIPFVVVRALPDALALRFEVDTALRRLLLVRLYTGEYRNEIEEVALIPAFQGSLKRLLG
jgi:cellulose synthase (UDP-forming)